MDKTETMFLKSQESKPLVWFWYIDDVFFIWTHGKEKPEKFLNEFSNYHPNIKSPNDFKKHLVSFLDLKVFFSGYNLATDLYASIGFNRL